ncbi:hypothetical protein BC629DRAFT_757562 [Irpex lacteus]|nr:hypothetical protein BC629DRAFT_757562 [Irpex lacteus]
MTSAGLPSNSLKQSCQAWLSHVLVRPGPCSVQRSYKVENHMRRKENGVRIHASPELSERGHHTSETQHEKSGSNCTVVEAIARQPTTGRPVLVKLFSDPRPPYTRGILGLTENGVPEYTAEMQYGNRNPLPPMARAAHTHTAPSSPSATRRTQRRAQITTPSYRQLTFPRAFRHIPNGRTCLTTRLCLSRTRRSWGRLARTVLSLAVHRSQVVPRRVDVQPLPKSLDQLMRPQR